MVERRSNEMDEIVTADARVREIGGRLRDARQERGEDLYDIADYLRIRPAYLFALEEGNFGATPGRPYALGFLRTYADYLGFDGQDLVGELKHHGPARAATATADAAGLEPVALGHQQPGSRKTYTDRDRSLPGAPVLAAAVLLIVLAYGGWYMMQGSGAATLDRVARLPGELGQYAVQLFEDEETRSGAAPPAEATAAPSPLKDKPLERLVPDVGLFERFSADDGGPATAPPEAPDEAAFETPAADGPGEQPPPDGPRVVLRALEPSWIQVKSEGRDYVRTRTLEPGEQFALPDRDDLALWTGNAGGIEILFEGHSLGPVGNRGAVMRDVSLAPEALLRRRGEG